MASRRTTTTEMGDGGDRDAADGGSKDSAGRDERVDALLEVMARTRGLAPRTPVRAQSLDRGALGAALRAHVERDLPHDVLRYQGEFLLGLGLVNPDYDYEKGVYGLIQSQLAGFYEPFDKTMYLVSDLGWGLAEFTLAHELVHALQDQHFELGTRFAYQPEANDLSSAIQALAEGDATSAAMDMMLARRGSNTATDVGDDELTAPLEGSMFAPELASVPYVLRASLVAPYVDGVRFVHALRRMGGWKAVDSAWRSPPTTTEQILHPDKFASHEAPIRIATPPAPKSGRWEIVYADVLGEEGLRIALESWVSRAAGAVTAEGWGGDKAVLYRSTHDGSGGSPQADRSSPTGGSTRADASVQGRRSPEGARGAPTVLASAKHEDRGTTGPMQGAPAGTEGLVGSSTLGKSGGGALGEPGIAKRMPESLYAVAWRIRFDPDVNGDPQRRSRRMFTALYEALKGAMAPSRTSFCRRLPGIGALVVGRSKQDVVVVAGPYQRTAGSALPRSNCQQVTTWARQILETDGTAP